MGFTVFQFLTTYVPLHLSSCYLLVFSFFFNLWFRWVEEDPKEILQSVYECMERTCEKLTQLNIDISNIKGMWTIAWCYRFLIWSRNWVFKNTRVNCTFHHFSCNILYFIAIGVTNQRETTIVWDKDTGEPLYNAIGKVLHVCSAVWLRITSQLFSVSMAEHGSWSEL